MFQFLIGNVLARAESLYKLRDARVSIPYRQCLSFEHLYGNDWLSVVSIPYRQCLSWNRLVVGMDRTGMFQFLIGNVLAMQALGSCG